PHLGARRSAAHGATSALSEIRITARGGARGGAGTHQTTLWEGSSLVSARARRARGGAPEQPAPRRAAPPLPRPSTAAFCHALSRASPNERGNLNHIEVLRAPPETPFCIGPMWGNVGAEPDREPPPDVGCHSLVARVATDPNLEVGFHGPLQCFRRRGLFPAEARGHDRNEAAAARLLCAGMADRLGRPSALP